MLQDFGNLSVYMPKTHLSLFHHLGKKGVPRDFILPISDCPGQHRLWVPLPFGWNDEQHAQTAHTALLLQHRPQDRNRASESLF